MRVYRECTDSGFRVDEFRAFGLQCLGVFGTECAGFQGCGLGYRVDGLQGFVLGFLELWVT